MSLQQPKFLGKIKVLQIFGSWCPNCLDETYFLSEWINQNPGKAEIIALSFESAETDAKAIKNIKKVINKTGASYTFLLASKNRSEFGPNKLFPDLVNFISYPTTIFLDKNNKVRKIHAGFNGPATGIYYDNFKSEFNSYINQLLKE